MFKRIKIFFTAKLVYIVIFLSFPSFNYVYCQGNYIFEHIKVEDGLSQSSVNNIFVDQIGFLWFATEHGLNRFDGKEIKIFTSEEDNPNSLSNYRIFCGLSDQTGNIWIGTETGLNKLDIVTNKFEKYYHNSNDPHSIGNNTIFCAIEDKNNQLWFGTGNGISTYLKTDNNFSNFAFHDIEDNPVRIKCIEEDIVDNDIFWLGTEGNGLIKFNKLTHEYRIFNFESNSRVFDTNRINVIRSRGNRLLYIGTHGGLILFDTQSQKVKDYKALQVEEHSFSTDRVNDIAFLPDGSIWFGTWNDGVLITDENLRNPINLRHSALQTSSLSNNRVLRLFYSQNIVWIGTYSGGINKLDLNQKKFSHIRSEANDKNGLTSNEIWGFFEDSKNNFWICTDKGLSKYNRRNKTFTHLTTKNSGISDNDIFSIAETKDGYLWIGTRFGLNRYNRGTGEFKKYFAGSPNSISENTVMDIFVDKEGILWAGTFMGLNKYMLSEDKFITYYSDSSNSNTISDEQVFCITEDNSNNLWIGTNYGLNKYSKRDNEWEHFFYESNNSNSLSNNRVYAVYFDETGILWIATLGGGLNRYDPIKNTFVRYRETDGLANDIVYGIVEDDNNNLWLSTNNGISKFNKYLGTFNNYSVQDGLQSSEFNYGAYYKSKDGTIYFGGVNGFNYFSPDDISINSEKPKTVITGFKIFNEQISPSTSPKLTKDIMFTKSIDLGYEENVFTIKFASLNFTAPSKNQFAYKIAEIHDNWILNGNQNSVTFTNLPPGDYLFKVISSNNDNVWNEEGASIHIIIQPPFYRSWWAYTIYVILAIGLVTLIVWSRNKLYKREIEVLQRADKLKTEFLAQMSHEIRSPINIILSFSALLKSEVEDHLDEDMREGFTSITNAGERIIRTIDLILNMSEIQTGIYDYRPEEINLYDDIFTKLHLEYSQKAKSKNLDFNIVSPSEAPLIFADNYTVMQIFANLIDNAIKYTSKGFIKIVIMKDNNHVIVEVIDSGQGIHPNYIPNLYKTFTQEEQGYTRKYEGNGLGLALVKKYVELNKAEINVESEKGRGTKFTVTFDYLKK